MAYIPPEEREGMGDTLFCLPRNKEPSNVKELLGLDQDVNITHSFNFLDQIS